MRSEFTSVDTIIFAGGKGERMGSLTDTAQKCLLPIDGKPILGHTLDSLTSAFGTVNTTICVFYRPEDVISYVEANKPSRMNVEYVYDTGGSRSAHMAMTMESRTNNAFVATAGDICVEPSAYRNGYAQVLKEGVFASLSLSPQLHEVDTHGVAKIQNGKVIDFCYPPPSQPDSDHLRDMTVWGISPDFYTYARAHTELVTVSSVVEEAINDGLVVAGNLYEGKWIHLGYPTDLLKTLK